MRIEVIYRWWCPECDAVNETDGGDPRDVTGVDVECDECAECGHVVTFDEED